MSRYPATVCQPVIKCAFEADGAFLPQVARENLETCCGLIEAAWTETRSKLFVLPQFCLQGYLGTQTRRNWIAHAVRLDGPEVKALGDLARKTNAYISGAAHEVCPTFPDRYFNTGFIIAPDGEVALAYRKHYALTPKSRPGDVFDAYVAAFGSDSLFPVLDTPLGKLGMAVAGDVCWPEMTRCLALKGAEIILNPNASPAYDYLDRPGGEWVRPVRAFENLTFLLTANHAGDGNYSPSTVFDYTGAAIAVAERGFNKYVTAMIDIEALRRFRAKPAANFIAQFQPHLHAGVYQSARLWPAHPRPAPVETTADILAIEKETWDRMTASGIFRGPREEHT
jgi:predicted amidohydrolase